MRPQGLFSVIIAAVVLVFVLAACQQTPQTDVIDPTPEGEIPATIDPVDPLPTAVDDTGDTEATEEAGEAAVVTVDLMDNAINMPATVTAGAVTFEVINNGTTEQNFMIEGAGVESMLDTAVAPGETATLEVELEPGTYTISSAPADGSTEGVTFELVVA